VRKVTKYDNDSRYSVRNCTEHLSEFKSEIRVLGFDTRRGLGIFLFTTASRTALGSTQPPLQWVQDALSLGAKRPEHETEHLLPSSAEVKECMEFFLHSPNTLSWRGAQLKNHRDKFIYLLFRIGFYKAHICKVNLSIQCAAKLNVMYCRLKLTFKGSFEY
jgi:hypothetical protein